MKHNGIIREIDKLGRIVIPIEYRRLLDINTGDEVEIQSRGDSIVLRKYQPRCLFCGTDSNLVELEGKSVCRACAEKLAAL